MNCFSIINSSNGMFILIDFISFYWVNKSAMKILYTETKFYYLNDEVHFVGDTQIVFKLDFTVVQIDLVYLVGKRMI